MNTVKQIKNKINRMDDKALFLMNNIGFSLAVISVIYGAFVIPSFFILPALAFSALWVWNNYICFSNIDSELEEHS